MKQEKELKKRKSPHGHDDYHHWYHHVADGCSCDGRRFKKKRPITHSDKTKMGRKELMKCTMAKDGGCQYCEAVKGKCQDPSYVTNPSYDRIRPLDGTEKSVLSIQIRPRSKSVP